MPQPLFASQQRLANRLIAECGMPAAHAERVAVNYRDHRPVRRRADNALVEYALTFSACGAAADQLADWVMSPALDYYKRLHLALGYTAQQFGAVGHIIEGLDSAEYEGHNGPDPATAAASWHQLLREVPPDFLVLCVQAGVTDVGELMDCNTKRLAGDPNILGQLSLLAALRGAT